MKRTPKKIVKRLLVVLAVAALITPFISIDSQGTKAADQSVIRVKLSTDVTTSLDFKLNGNYGIKEIPGNVLGSGSYSVKVSGSSLKLYCGSNVLYTGSDITIKEYKPADGTYNLVTLPHGDSTRNYLGSVRFKLSSGNIMTINQVYIDYYLYGVVPYEMSDSWSIEALKTQAVAARTYAERYMDGAGDYDVVDTSANQVYAGYNPSYTNAVRAVNETAKTVLVCNGKLVQTYFAASNGGQVDIAQHVWSSTATLLPYQVLQGDPYDVLNTSSMQEVLTFPKVMDGTDGIEYQNSPDNVQSDNAEKYLKDSAIPIVAAIPDKGYIAAVPSDITIDTINSIVPKTYDITRGQHHYLNDYAGANPCLDFTEADINMTVLANRKATQEEYEQTGESLVQEQVTVDFTIDLHQFDDSESPYCAFTKSDTTLRLITVEETDTSWNVYHRRYGHGVGMSQRGAQQRARAGQGYQEILSFYYPNTQFQVLDISAPVLEELPSATPNATIINCSSYVNVRKTPNTDYAAIGQVNLGDRICVTQPYYTSTWHQIYYNGQTAYIYANYVLLDPPPASEAPSESPAESVPPEVSPSDSPSESPSAEVSPSDSVDESVSPDVSPSDSLSESPSAEESPSDSPSQSPSPSTPDIAATGTVVSATLNIRTGPGTAYSKVGTFIKGDTVSIIEVEPVKDWHKIWYKGAVAYVWADYVRIASPAPTITATGTVTTSVLNIRTGPSTSYSKIGSFVKGDSVDIVKANYNSKWHQIWYKGRLTYVYASYVKINTENTSQPDPDPAPESYAVVNASRLNMRSTPSIDGEVIDTLTQGVIVQVLEQGGEWNKVRYGGLDGYMYASYLKQLDMVYGKVTITSLNVRSGPSSSTTILGKLKKGEVVEIIEKGSKWHKIRYGSSVAYVYASYIKLI